MLAHRSLDRLLILLTDGELIWNAEAADFDWTRTSALATTLQGKFAGEPVYVDLRWAKSRERLSLNGERTRCGLWIVTDCEGRSPRSLQVPPLRLCQLRQQHQSPTSRNREGTSRDRGASSPCRP
jgi:hypothetical protein